jgi:hypothetical protein
VRGRRPAGEAGDHQVVAAPEETNRTALAGEAGTKGLEDPVGLQQHAPVAVDALGIIGRMHLILGERDGVRDLVRDRMKADLDPEPGQEVHEPPVEVCDRHRPERQSACSAVAHRDEQPMVDEIEVDLELAQPVRDRQRCEATRGDVEGRVPGVIEPRGLGQPNLADDLGHRCKVVQVSAQSA